MKLIYLKETTGLMGLLLMAAQAHAGTAVWTYSAPNPASLTVTNGDIATVQYTVTNQSSKAKHLLLQATPGLSASPCYLAGKGSSCNLTLTINGSLISKGGLHGGPVLCEQGNPNQCYQPSSTKVLSVNWTSGTSELTASVSELALMVSGMPRVITLTNNGGAPATHLFIAYPSWPTNTQVDGSSTCANGMTLAAHGGSCTIVIAPGSTSTSDCSSTPSITVSSTGTAPTPGVIAASADGGLTASIGVVVLGYGCQYQGGFVFSIDDSTINTTSIKGKVASLVDEAPASPSGGIIWSSNGAGSTPANVSFDKIPGIDQTSTSSSAGSPTYSDFSIYFESTYTNRPAAPSPSAFQSCDGGTNGYCNTQNILAFYNTWVTNYNDSCRSNGNCVATAAPPATPLTDYAAGLCQGTINGQTGWYLPAVCEMNSSALGSDAACIATQAINENLFFMMGASNGSCNPPSGTDCFTGYYWSSTENSGFPQNGALPGCLRTGNCERIHLAKSSEFGVRCVRGF